MADARVQDYLSYSKWLFLGWVLGLLVGWGLDHYFNFGNPVLEGISRFIVGYGDTIGASLGVLVARLRTRRKSHAETFWMGTVLGTLVGPLVHFGLLRLGFSSAGIPGALIAIAYSNADNWGGVLSSFMQVKRGKRLQAGLAAFRVDKFVVANLIILVLMFLVAIGVRLAGFAPASYLATAIEGAILDNDSTLAVVLFVLWLKARPNPQQSIDSDCQRG